MNRRLTILWLWMYVNRTCFVDFFATVKRGFIYVPVTLTHTHSLTQSRLESKKQPKGVS